MSTLLVSDSNVESAGKKTQTIHNPLATNDAKNAILGMRYSTYSPYRILLRENFT